MGTAWDVFKAVWGGKSNGRALMNRAVAVSVPVLPGGVVLDIGSGKEPSSTFKRLRFSGPIRRVSVDLQASGADVACDVQEGLPFPDASADAACLLNVVYLLKEPVKALREIRRVLKPGGCLVLTAPLVFNEAPEPKDYLRYTREGASELLLKPSGFRHFELHPYGGRASAAAFLAQPLLRPRPVYASLSALAATMDSWLEASCPIGYIGVAYK